MAQGNSTVDETEWRVILKHEFEAEENSFVLQLRCGRWDKEAQLRLFQAMIECCKAHEGQAKIERWIVEGFWWLNFYPRQMFGGRKDTPDYCVNAIDNFDHLAFWLFTGQDRADHEFEPMQ